MDQLTKSSTSEEIKEYFNAILKLAKTSEKYPVDLDEVWPLVYSEKSKAVRALRDNFIEDVDFITIAQNGEGDIINQPRSMYVDYSG